MKIYNPSISQSKFLKRFNEDGFVLINQIFPNELLQELNIKLANCIKIEQEKYYNKNHKDYGMLLCCPIYGEPFTNIFDYPQFFNPFNWLIGSTSIVWVYTSSCIPPNQQNYASRIHVDRPFFTGSFLEGVGSLILLDDFTSENGATFLLPSSQNIEQQPDDAYFYKNAIPLIAPKGTVLYFNLRLWHAAGNNRSNNWRNAIGIGMVRPYIKQRIDIPRILPHAVVENLSDFAKQKLGFFAQPPSSLDEYYNRESNPTKIQPSEWK